MKKIFISVVCILSLCLSGCTSSESNKNKPLRLLVHKEVVLPDMLVGYPGGIQKLGDELVIMDYTSDFMFHRVSLPEGKYLGGFGSKGQGPDEFVHPTALHPYGRNALCCYDLGRREIKLLEKDSLTNGLKSSVLLSPSRLMAFDVVPFTSGRFVANGCFNDSTFCLLDESGKYIALSGSYPIKDEQEKSYACMTRAMAYQGVLRVTPNGRMAFATHHAKVLYLYNVEKDRLIPCRRLIESYNEYLPDHTVNSGAYSVAHKGDLPVCFRDLCLTDEAVYALYSGRSFQEYSLASNECEYLSVYDWSGNEKETYRLDVPVLCFCVDEQLRIVYAIANKPDPVLVKFFLPSVNS